MRAEHTRDLCVIIDAFERGNHVAVSVQYIADVAAQARVQLDAARADLARVTKELAACFASVDWRPFDDRDLTDAALVTVTLPWRHVQALRADLARQGSGT
jgi:hypothetical protein